MSNESAGGRIKRPAMLGASHLDASEYGDEVTHLELIKRRHRHLGGSILFYHDPVHIVRGEGVFLYDDEGCKYLDCYNNVPSVGHCHPRVIEALTRQANLLNTHTRYLHENVIEYAEKLAGTFPGDLEVCMLVCTGTEANELAMRMARTVSGNNGAIVVENSYHGNSTLIAEMSTVGYAREKRPDHVVAVEPPNTYRGPFRRTQYSEDELGKRYAALVDEAIRELDQRGQRTAAFMCDAIFDSQGVLEAPGSYFSKVYKKVRSAGGLCIADEVQAGLGRTGVMWGFENYGVIPDIVTLGKPMGDGHPVAAVVTTRKVAQKFAAAEIYFNTFGGNPVSAAVGAAVLDICLEQDIVAHVKDVGAYLRAGLERLATDFPVIGDVHGLGLFQAIELVNDHQTLDPASALASQLPDALRAEGVLIGLSGRFGNVLKIRPPLVFDRDNADQLLSALRKVLKQFGEHGA
jgi:4-aminobutyrate aminotransferase-like enzyme